MKNEGNSGDPTGGEGALYEHLLLGVWQKDRQYATRAPHHGPTAALKAHSVAE